MGKDGRWTKDEDEMAGLINEYFEDIFSSINRTLEDIKGVLEWGLPQLENDDQQMLSAAYTLEEATDALFAIHPNKASGLDGFPTSFFHRFWHAMEPTLAAVILRALNGEEDMRDWNRTLIVLIPKAQSPHEIKDFRPVSLCNILYKVVANVLVNRLRKVIGKVVDESQSAFVPGRAIIDNIMIGYEFMHKLRNTRGGKQGFAALKLDMSKTYDRIEWSYLEVVSSRCNEVFE